MNLERKKSGELGLDSFYRVVFEIEIEIVYKKGRSGI